MIQNQVIIVKIIEKQETIIGPIALEEAKKVSGLEIDWSKKEVTLKGDEKEIIEKLVESYTQIFGKASTEACKKAVKGIITDIPADQLPKVFR